MPTSSLRVIVLVIALLLPSVVGCGGGILLSKTRMVSNDDYSEATKKQIAAIKATLSDQDARSVLREAFGDNAVADNGLRPTITVRIDDRTSVENTGSVQRTTTYSHEEERQVDVPFTDIRHVRIKTVKASDGAKKVVDFTTPVTAFNKPYYGANLFALPVNANADEPRLIASLLHLCVNLEESSWASF